MPTSQRADARRNYERILAVAKAEVASQGGDASLEKIARVAGVGSATVRRHFPTRYALLEAVSSARVDDLCAYSRTLQDSPNAPREVVLAWLRELVDYCVSTRGLVAALSYGEPDGSLTDNSCFSSLQTAVTPLLHRAQEAGEIASDITPGDLLMIILGLVLATAGHSDRMSKVHRLLRISIEGISPAT
ncbi:TetR/AcrR family transcriptional regulator [Amycolatopsis sp. GM8]|uniref:TetR/AcrR family transcriptional regulator n=1 Tax=Amycolatopsis sp. GM8 TaxID=2896530 RepID=UPI001F4699BC|nr:TetR/AcrR family transcriptional regulator [Amycolatopsis sp. GM8]